ncbi:hypothetical protein [Curtobacterium sp. MCBA15_004]|uniref:hypothetical protein n=1 Tax=Curtobacterium sp. MCBA15_004 TaxID=1898733 RepID=UPI0008DDF177|nr:hypothetical protein [Curtobacterium sp. MCBA15_004]WIA95769.1 hypothetical protein QOL16_11685 [Curtobacterium sp. MCBA15_004]
MIDIKWEDPEPDARIKYDWAAMLAALRSRPGEWALIFEDAPASVATNLKRGIYADSKPGEFETARRSVKKSRAKIYARYVGGSNG